MSDTRPADPATQAEFRKLMSLFATGVCVVSFDMPEAEHGISGMTVNSLVSVSLDPMLVCWNLQNSASQYEEYLEAEDFAISILAGDQQALARRYAARGDSALTPADFRRTSNGMPVIRDALATIECRRWAAHPAGDHTLILGEVQAMETSGSGEPRALGFFNGHFRAIDG
ncbi:flavin reductase family protein [Erythrobacter sp. GH1-10]|uniref:flavin reductase family protein n=1 Tax=Erythrobacter sp. GH1-10 TaxID=3349334 RepID=UPI003877D414